MAIKLRCSQRLSVVRPSDISIKATGIDPDLISVWFIIGFKRTTGAPTTVADLTDKFQAHILSWDAGSYVAGDTATVDVVGKGFNGSGFYPSALAGDHMYLLVIQHSFAEPSSGATFDASLPLGTLRA